MNTRITRRTFHKLGAAAALGVSPAMRALSRSAGERIRLGFIGVGNRGRQLIGAFLKHADMEIAALCDVDQGILARARSLVPGQVEAHEDFRRVIERNDIDAVVIASPDHWHAIQTVQACDAGKDVYVEKPLSITIHEGRRMVAAARRNERVVQVGMQRRSSSLWARAAKLTTSGEIGKITLSRAYRLNNMFPAGMGKEASCDPPVGLNWDLWLGPRPHRAYQSNIHPYKFRWWRLYSSQMANWGVHYLDMIRMLTGELAPSSVCAMGGVFAVDDDRTIPDTLEATFQFASGRLAIFGQYEASSNPMMPSGQVELRGTQGTLYIGDRSFEIIPERGGQFQDRAARMEPARVEGERGDLTVQHTRNFLDCVRSRATPAADVEEGHRSTTCSLLANISWVTGLRLEWDAAREVITSSAKANELLHYEYRKPWTLG